MLGPMDILLLCRFYAYICDWQKQHIAAEKPNLRIKSTPLAIASLTKSQFNNITCNIVSTVFTVDTHCYLICLLAPVVEIFINHTMSGKLIYMYAVSMVAIGVHGKLAQSVINWNGFLFGCLSTAKVFAEGA